MTIPIVAAAVLAAPVVVVPAASKPSGAVGFVRHSSGLRVPAPGAVRSTPAPLLRVREVVDAEWRPVRGAGRPDPRSHGNHGNHRGHRGKAIRPGEAVPNDYYEVNQGHRLFTYRVPARAHVTVLTNPGT